jgi:hypothetical protein
LVATPGTNGPCDDRLGFVWADASIGEASRVEGGDEEKFSLLGIVAIEEAIAFGGALCGDATSDDFNAAFGYMETLLVSRIGSPLSRRRSASLIWCGVILNGRPIFKPRALARARFTGAGTDQLPLELSQATQHGQHQATVRAGGVGPCVSKRARTNETPFWYA